MSLIVSLSMGAVLYTRAPPRQAKEPVAAVVGAGQDPCRRSSAEPNFSPPTAPGATGSPRRGSAGAPDLVRSILSSWMTKPGILIAPVIRNGRPDLGMPKSSLPDAGVGDIVAWLHVQTWSAGHRSNYAFKDVLTGDAKQGEAYFNKQCASCHSASGDLKGIGSRYDAFALQARWLQPRGGRGRRRKKRRTCTVRREGNRSATSVTVTLANGPAVTGTLVQVDDFTVPLPRPSRRVSLISSRWRNIPAWRFKIHCRPPQRIARNIKTPISTT